MTYKVYNSNVGIKLGEIRKSLPSGYSKAEKSRIRSEKAAKKGNKVTK